MYYVGIDIGASSVKVAAVDAEGAVMRVLRRAHRGSPLPCLRALLDELAGGEGDPGANAALTAGGAGEPGVSTSPAVARKESYRAEGEGACESDSVAPATPAALQPLPLDACGGVMVTGSGAGMVRALMPGLRELEEVPALVKGVRALAPQAACVVQMGAQSGVFATGFAAGAAPEFAMNESCAAGTGSFFEDQMQRLGLPLDSYSDLVAHAQSVPRLSGRCSVFAKTDIIHRQQEGVPVEDILQGLCHATVKAFKATIVRSLPVEKPLALAGGTLLNAGVVRAVREVFDLGEDELLADSQLVNAQAVGAALAAAEAGEGAGRVAGSADAFGIADGTGAAADNGAPVTAGTSAAGGGAEAAGVVSLAGEAAISDASADNRGASPHSASQLSALRAALDGETAGQANDLVRLPRLPQVDCTPNRGFALAPSPWNPAGTPARDGGAVPRSAAVDTLAPGAPVPVALGVDVGSTSTNLVLVSADGVLLDAQYLRTRGNPKQAVRDGLASLAQRVGSKAHVVAAGVTGSGRTMIGNLIGADAVRDEITAQARAAAAADPQVDTVFEIGGQDSKYIGLAAGQVADFQMNKVCAAGTGSFVEEQAARLGIALPDYGALALSAKQPVDLGERCTVFVETAINAALAKGATKPEVAAGLCLSVVRNYLHKVVNNKPVGRRIVLQGGVAYNPAIVAAFRAYAGDGLTVSPYFAVSGAVGAALLAAEAQGILSVQTGVIAGGESGTSARAKAGEVAFASIRVPEMNAASASLTVSYVPERAAVSTSRTAPEFAPASGAFPPSNFKGWDLSGASHATCRVDPDEIAANRAFFHKVDEMYLEGYDPQRDPAKKTVGIPRALMLHKLFPMANAFFKQLGFNVVLTDASSEETVRLAQASAQGETCYPVKLVHGHMAQLLDAGVDYVFMPSVHTIRHLKSTVPHNYACTYMQSIPAIVAKELDYEGHGITLLNPQMNLDFGQGAMAEVMLEVGAQLGRTPQETARAMLAGGFAVTEFTRKTEELGDQLLASLKPGERVIVIITRNYGIVDPALNMGIPDLLLDRGQKVITVSHLHAHDLGISADYPGVVWPFGQHILSGAKLVRRDPRLFAVYLTNHGCGPDTMISHLFAEEMAGKPYLQIEMDEHYSKVGVETRVEAFLNAIEHYEAADLRGAPTSARVVNSACEPVRKGELAGLPSFRPYGPLVAQWLRDQGISVRELVPSAQTLELGRKECTSKEYYSFASLLGLSLAAAEGAKDEVAGAADCALGAKGEGTRAGSTVGDVENAGGARQAEETASTKGAVAEDDGVEGPVRQLLLLSSQGGEADGQFDRVVRSVLDAKGYADVRVIAPDVELLPCNLDDPEGFFVRMLAGDVIWAAAPEARSDLLKRLAKPNLALADVLAAAREVGAAASVGTTVCSEGLGSSYARNVEAETSDISASFSFDAAEKLRLKTSDASVRDACSAAGDARKTLAVVGEWPLAIGDELTGGLFAQLEAEGYRVVRAPFAEYLLFNWEDGCDEAKHAKVVGGLMPMLGETGAPKTVGLPDAPAATSSASVRDSAVDVRCSAAALVDGPAPSVFASVPATTVPALAPADPDQKLTIADVQALASGCEAACANALGGCNGSHDHGAAAVALATGPLEVGADVQANPLFGAEQRTLPQDEWRALLARLADMMVQVSQALGAASPYANDYAALRQVATDALGQFAGANAHYRYVKAVEIGDRTDGVIEVASTYENVDIMLRLKGIPSKAPLLHLAFDGALDQSVEERLRSFLYYV